MAPQQRINQPIRDFVCFINEEFMRRYGNQNWSNKNQEILKSQWLMNGVNDEIWNVLHDKIIDEDNPHPDWPELVEAAQNAEWYLDLSSGWKHRYWADPVHWPKLRNRFIAVNQFVQVETDGACSRNGYPDAQAGIGVYWGENHALNVSEPLEKHYPATNNVAEIVAIIRAVKTAKIYGIRRLAVTTDSLFVYDSLTKWILKWLINGWLTLEGNPVKNKEQFRELLFAMEDMDIHLVHVRRASNEKADQLAKQGAAKY